MKGIIMLVTMQKLGVVPSFGHPRVSDDNPCSESLFKKMKYCPVYSSRSFSSIEEALAWVNEFVDWYKNQHLHSGFNFVKPSSRHEVKDVAILEKCKQVSKMKNWNNIEKVYLNNLQEEDEVDKAKAS